MLEDKGFTRSSEESQAALEQSTYTEDGVDLTLIRWMLSLTPAERLRALQNAVRSIQRLRSLKSARAESDQ